jgi:putative glutamine amidotransferase
MRHLILSAALLITGHGCIAAQDTLLLFHPTADNLEVLENLARMDMLDLKGYHILGIYHAGEVYDYDLARDMIRDRNDDLFSLRELNGQLNPWELFGPNGCTEDFFDLFCGSRGAFFMGGPDIPPRVYNEPVHLLTGVTDPFRHYMEISFLFHLLGGNQDSLWIPYLEQDLEYLVSGICLGMQTMNVSTGGTMIQDIPTEIYGIWYAEELLNLPPDQVHRNYNDLVNLGCDEPTSYHFHRIRLIEGSFLQKDLPYRGRNDPLVLSSHHQALERLGAGWKVSASSVDGKIIEAMEHEFFPHVAGVQFHPEKPGLFEPSVIHPKSCNELINFREVIRDTDSYDFHKAYWNYLGAILQKIRRK